MTETVTNRAKFIALSRMLSGAGGTMDCRLLGFTGTATGTDDPDLNFVADLDAVSGVSIHSERLTLTGEAASEDDANNRAAIDSDNATFAAAGGVTLQGVALYQFVTNDADSPLLVVYTTGFPHALDAGLTLAITDLLRAT